MPGATTHRVFFSQFSSEDRSIDTRCEGENLVARKDEMARFRATYIELFAASREEGDRLMSF